MCGITYNKTEDKQFINNCLVDKYESAPANLVLAIIINAKIDTENMFGQQVDPEVMIDLDVIVQALAKGLRNILSKQRLFIELILP